MHFLFSCIAYFFPLANVYLSSLDTLDAVSRQFTDEFRIQDIPQQHIRMSRFRAIKASLFRCMKDGAGQAVDCYVCQLLVAIAAAFRSLLKSSHTAAEQLASKLLKVSCARGRSYVSKFSFIGFLWVIFLYSDLSCDYFIAVSRKAF